MLQKENDFHALQIQGISAAQLLQRFDTLEAQLKNLQQPQPTPTDELLSRSMVAEYLGISLVTLHNWNKSGILNPLRIGNKVRYKKSEVLASLQSINSK